MAKDKKQLKQAEKSYKAEIAAAEKEIDSDKKTYRKAVKTLLKADNQLKPIARKAAKRPTDKNMERLEEAKKSSSCGICTSIFFFYRSQKWSCVC